MKIQQESLGCDVCGTQDPSRKIETVQIKVGKHATREVELCEADRAVIDRLVALSRLATVREVSAARGVLVDPDDGAVLLM